MATSEQLRRELDGILREIDELREYESQIEMALGTVPGRLRWLRAPNACLLKKGIDARIESLILRHNIVRNCYLACKRAEKRERPRVPARSPA